jgi:hypothetical protein
MQVFTKDQLIERLKQIAASGWIPNARHGNHGGIGNTLEDLLGIEENNLPIPNAAEWELKARRKGNSLITLFHMEPSPTAIQFIPRLFLPSYGWQHKEAGMKYPANEMSFRQTINAKTYTDRGFIIKVDRSEEKILISFDISKVAQRHLSWVGVIRGGIGIGELSPQPYWGFDDLRSKVGTKLLNCFYVQAEVKKEAGMEFYKYSKVWMLQKFSFDNFLLEIEKANVLVDFDARTGHNHGTKFRIRQNHIPNLYEKTTVIL